MSLVTSLGRSVCINLLHTLGLPDEETESIEGGGLYESVAQLGTQFVGVRVCDQLVLPGVWARIEDDVGIRSH